MGKVKILSLGTQLLQGEVAKGQESQNPGAEAMKTSAHFLLSSLSLWLLWRERQKEKTLKQT